MLIWVGICHARRPSQLRSWCTREVGARVRLHLNVCTLRACACGSVRACTIISACGCWCMRMRVCTHSLIRVPCEWLCARWVCEEQGEEPDCVMQLSSDVFFFDWIATSQPHAAQLEIL